MSKPILTLIFLITFIFSNIRLNNLSAKQEASLLAIRKGPKCQIGGMQAGSIYPLFTDHRLPITNYRSTSSPFLENWVDSVFNSMNADQRIGQLFMVAAYSNKDEIHHKAIENLIKNYNIGGLIFFKGTPYHQAKLINRYQSIARVPLLIAMDAEWGLAMRLDSTISFPRQMTLGAIQDNQYIYRMGAEIARQCKRIGVHVNLAPVVDINSNPNNPVIGIRSFGENKENVALKGIAYMKGLQQNSVMANAKHFPGHGDTDTDSHLTLPVIKHSKKRLDEIELYPFKRLINEGLMSIMVAHLHVPAYDDTVNRATTLSKAVVTGLLKKDLGFRGLIFTDALNMRGVSQFYKPGDVDLKALLAGNDVLLFSEKVPVAIKKIKQAVRRGIISMEEIDKRVKKILRAKFWVGLYGKNGRKEIEEIRGDNFPSINLNNIYEDLNTNYAKFLQQELYEKALTVVQNQDDLIPFKIIDTNTFASVSIGLSHLIKGELDGINEFQKMLSLYAPFDHFSISEKALEQTYNDLLNEVFPYKTVVVSIHKMNNSSSRGYGISKKAKDFIKQISKKTKTILVVFGNPYSLKYFEDNKWLVCAYEDNEVTQKVVPQLLFGAISANGKLPVSASSKFKEGVGLTTESLKRLIYSFPESVGMNSKTLLNIDTIVLKAIADSAMPGCQVLIAKDGNVIFNKSYGYLTYKKQQLVTNQTIYDVASVTKVAGTLQAIMFLKEQGLLDLDAKASEYLSELKTTNKKDLLIRDIMSHQAGLVPYIEYWKRTIDSSGMLSDSFYSNIKSEKFPNLVVHRINAGIALSDGVLPGVNKGALYSISSMEDTIWQWTIDSDMIKKKKKKHKYGYKYSDLGFYIMKRIAEKLLNQSIEEFLDQNFYTPLSLNTLNYQPQNKFEIKKIAPTEYDTNFRKTLICGTVHDPGAAMVGGVAGHAGIFSNANALSILMQMNLQHGYYGGLRYFKSETIPEFTTKQFDNNRRGLGWDKPDPDGHGPTSNYASANTFGHSGFTGTCVWVDPDCQLVYVFLSNRVYPNAYNTKLITKNIRTRIHDVIYRAME